MTNAAGQPSFMTRRPSLTAALWLQRLGIEGAWHAVTLAQAAGVEVPSVHLRHDKGAQSCWHLCTPDSVMPFPGDPTPGSVIRAAHARFGIDPSDWQPMPGHPEAMVPYQVADWLRAQITAMKVARRISAP